jgi:hypothetical protein
MIAPIHQDLGKYAPAINVITDYYCNDLLPDISVDCAAAYLGANRSSGGGHIAIGC